MNIFRLIRSIASHPLNCGGRVRALSRFARWQLSTRLIGQPIAVPFVGETRLLMRRGMTGASGNWYNGLHEPAEMAFVLHALREDDLFADIGANVGSYTVLAAGAVGAQVLSVEPLPSTYAGLIDNIRLNDLTARVQAHNCGISDRAGELRFTSGLDTMNRVALPGEDLPTCMVPVITLDVLCAARVPNLIKIDVEGHELAVLGGGPKVLASPQLQAVLIETNGSGARYGLDDAGIIEQMKQFGFGPCRYDWLSRSVIPVARGSANTIFVRDPAEITKRCRSAPQFQLINGVV